jgi:hypothetical protein
MTADFTKFPFPSLHQPQAATVTEAIRAEPVSTGFAIITLKATDADGFAADVRAFAQHLRAEAGSSLERGRPARTSRSRVNFGPDCRMVGRSQFDPKRPPLSLIDGRQRGVAFPELVVLAVLQVAAQNFLSGFGRKEALAMPLSSTVLS